MASVERRIVPIESVQAEAAARLRRNRVELGVLLDDGLRELGPERLRRVVTGLGISAREATDAVALALAEGRVR